MTQELVELMDKQELEHLLSRLREAVLFLIKADAVVFAGTFALVGAFKPNVGQALLLGASFSWVLKLNVILLIASLLYEGILTSIARGSDTAKNLSVAKILRFAYLFLVLLHTSVAAYALGYFVSFFEGVSQS